jgi:hypothetical protein
MDAQNSEKLAWKVLAGVGGYGKEEIGEKVRR